MEKHLLNLSSLPGTLDLTWGEISHLLQPGTQSTEFLMATFQLDDGS